VALKNGEVRVYREKQLLDCLNVGMELTALRFGKFGREDNSLIMVNKGGSLTIKVGPIHTDAARGSRLSR
jgi:Bardet-Biedl syndrome 1 protein